MSSIAHMLANHNEQNSAATTTTSTSANTTPSSNSINELSPSNPSKTIRSPLNSLSLGSSSFESTSMSTTDSDSTVKEFQSMSNVPRNSPSTVINVAMSSNGSNIDTSQSNSIPSTGSSSGSLTRPQTTPSATLKNDITANTTTEPTSTSSNDSNSATNNGQDSQQQKKRSKVSRACDECRRKKIRCDATFSTTSNTVLKPCTSCSKNNETCSFARVPLKRGPTKGYTKDGDHQQRERSRSSTSTTRRSSSMGSHFVPSQHQQQLYQQQQQQQAQQSSSSPITLPPLVSLTSNVPFKSYSPTGPSTASGTSPNLTSKESSELSQPSSPRRGSGFGQLPTNSTNNSHNGSIPNPNPNGSVPQGLFWKVPYNQGPFDRRGSVDSVSSSLSEARSPRFSSAHSSAHSSIAGPSSNGSSNALPIGGNFIFGQRPSTSYESSIVSDSDDERGSNYSPRASVDISRTFRSRSNSTNLQPPTSPALSVSSINSFSQGFNKNINIQNQQPQQDTHNVALAQQQQHQMIEIYYQFIHLGFPILPLNKKSLGNLLNIPHVNASDPNASEINEISSLIVQCFYSALDTLIVVVSRSSRSPSVVAIQNGSNVEANFVEIINKNFANLIKLFPVFQSKFHFYSQNIIILLASTLVISSYSMTLSGIESDLYLSSSISIFNKLKIFKIFWDENHSVSSDNYDDYNSILKRLYLLLNIIDTLQSLSFGVPKLMSSIDFDFTIVNQLIPSNANYNVIGLSPLESEVIRNNLKFGLILTKISSSRNFSDPSLSSNQFIAYDLKNKFGYFQNILNKNVSKQVDSIPLDFLDFVLLKFELITFLEEVGQINTISIDEELVYDFQLKASRIVKKHLELQSSLLKSIKNYTNSIESNLLISPFLPILFKQSIKSLNIEKIIINSLQINKDLITRLSKPLNELISLNNYLSLLKPLKIDELNNHMNFNFFSDHINHLEVNEMNDNISHSSKLLHWIGLMNDLKEFIEKDDYEGWF